MIISQNDTLPYYRTKFPCIISRNAIVAPNKCLNGWLLSFQFVIFSSVKRDLQMMVENANKNVFEIVTMLNNLVLVCRFYDHNLVFCSLYMIHEICVFC